MPRHPAYAVAAQSLINADEQLRSAETQSELSQIHVVIFGLAIRRKGVRVAAMIHRGWRRAPA